MSPTELGIIISLVPISLGVVALACKVLLTRPEPPRQIYERIAKLETHMSALWEVWGMDAMRSARTGGFLEAHSNELPSSKWYEICPNGLNENLESTLNELAPYHNAYELAIEVYTRLHDQINQVALENDLPVQTVFGVVQALARAKKDS